jgi:hypothetical protein
MSSFLRGEVGMQKLLNFLLIILIFTVLQVTNVGAQDTAALGSAATGQMDQDCAQLHPGGAATHVDPPESQIESIEAEYRASCESMGKATEGNCAISDATYSSLESQGHSRAEVDCFMAEGERDANRGPNDHMNDGQHYDQGNHGGMQGNHGGMQGNHGGMQGNHGGMQGNHGGMTGDHGGMQGNHGGMQGNHGGMQGNHGGMQGNHGGMQGNHGGMQGNHGGMQGNHGGMTGDHGGMQGNHGGMQGNHGGMQGNHGGR